MIVSFVRRAALAASVLTLALVFPGAGAAAQSSEPAFDIGLAVDVDSVTVEPLGELALAWRAPDGNERTLSIREPLRMRLSGTQLIVEGAGRARAVPLAILEVPDTLWLGSAGDEAGAAPRFLWNGKHWRGRFKVFPSPRRKLTLATRLSLENYLLGVVPGEIGALRDSLIEAGRAQAVAARSYSLFYRGRRGAEGFDLYATVEDQVYGPVESERPLATRCVETTRGMTALADGAPIRANYCSTCGGVSAEVWEAWPADARSYLRSGADQGVGQGDHCALSPQYRWREEWTVAEFAANLGRFGPAQNLVLPAAGVGDVRDVRVDSRSRSGRVWRLRVTTTTGEIVIPAYSLRQVLRRPGNSNGILRSNLFKIAARRDTGGRVTSIVASGAGSGHGVGLCQTGALAMARGGAKAESILAHYYSGSELRRLY